MKKILIAFSLFLLVLKVSSQSLGLDFSTLSINPCAFCPAGTICQNNRCVLAKDICQYLKCLEGQICKNGECVQTEQKQCLQDFQCSQGLKCINGSCKQAKQNIQNECLQQCGANQVCSAGICVDISIQNEQKTSNPCDNITCQKQFTCSSGQCIHNTLLNFKNCYISPCDAGQHCYFGQCLKNEISDQCKTKCNSDKEVCVNNNCFSIDQDIKSFCKDIKCNENEVCSFGECIPDQFQKLCQTSNCGSKELCYFGFCFADTVRKNVQTCYDKVCEPGNLCINGKCIQTLKVFKGLCNDVKCNEGQTCMFGNCVDDKIKANCDSLRCKSDSICMLGQCFPIFSTFEGIFSQNNQNESKNSTNSKSSPPTIPGVFPSLISCDPTCKTGQMCILGSCVAMYQNQNQCDPKCKESEKCSFGFCIPKDPCEGIQCKDNQVCSAGKCTQNLFFGKGQCKQNQDCKDGGQCFFGTCYNIPSLSLGLFN